MAEYIERDALIHHFMTKRQYLTKDLVLDAAYEISQISTADVAPVRRGRWKNRIDTENEMHECSECGARVVKGLYEYENPNRFCYCCGARMDGGADNAAD